MPRTVNRPSASALERSLACPLSEVLPRPPEPPKGHNAPAARGDRSHSALERAVMGARMEDVVHVLLHGDLLNLKDVLAKMPVIHPIEGYPSIEAECWLNPLTGEADVGVPNTIVPPGYWRGRADRIGWYDHPTAGRVPCVMDYKTGNPAFQAEGDCAQLGYFATWLSIMLEVDEVYGIIYLTQDPDRPRGHLWTRDEITTMFRRMHDHEARLQVLETNDVLPEANPSQKSCHFCPVKSVCPSAWKKGRGDAP
jgi:CRISPR/Cas system-associated exonuclease Cas4 (RecB family)